MKVSCSLRIRHLQPSVLLHHFSADFRGTCCTYSSRAGWWKGWDDKHTPPQVSLNVVHKGKTHFSPINPWCCHSEGGVEVVIHTSRTSRRCWCLGGEGGGTEKGKENWWEGNEGAGELSLQSSTAAPVEHFSPRLSSHCYFWLPKALHLENRKISARCINNFPLVQPRTPGNCLKASCLLQVCAEVAIGVTRGIIIMKREWTW